ncbi:hypothetical protein BLNAU_1950 [Blattamonas nauphoetae]|uniref:Ankyrin repeat protein n=1 Tax=Blattamonas nauphoetae TaxID=2049346 RepID=A0ABQ9WN89_9EUKA|nr:hypothetical protein BLNAU_24132 [Blattamonas nauphoetae]KAK2962927.1 hypothetical protein BLNAU_1950 [Blattamonas nauphoetae]
MMRLLIESRANPFLEDRYGMTPLHHVCTLTLRQPFSVILGSMMPEGIVPSFPQQISNITATFTDTTVLAQPCVNVVMSDRQRERFELVCCKKVSSFRSLNQTITLPVFLHSNSSFNLLLRLLWLLSQLRPSETLEASALGRRNSLHILAE